MKVSTNYQKAVLGLILAVFFVLPLPQKFSSAIIGLLILVSLVEFFKRPDFAKVRPHWFLPTLFLYYLISELVSGGTWLSIEKRFLFLALPLVFTIIPDTINEQPRNRIYLAYIFGNVFSIISCFTWATIRSVTIQNGQWTFNPFINQSTQYDFLTSSVMDGNYFFGSEFSLFIDPPYFALYIVFGQFLIFEIVQSSENKRMRGWLIGIYIVMLLALFLLSSKSAIISALILILYIGFRIFLKARGSPFLRISALAGVVAISILFIFFNPRLRVFKDTFWEGMAINPNARFGHDLRILSWDASLDIIKKNWLFGVGEGKVESALLEVYIEKGYTVPAEEKFNSHNQYLDFLLSGGVIGLGLFMTGFIQLIVRSIRKMDFPLLAFCLIFSFNALFENLLSRYAGILLFTIFICLFQLNRPESK